MVHAGVGDRPDHAGRVLCGSAEAESGLNGSGPWAQLDTGTLLALFAAFVTRKEQLLELDSRRRVYDYIQSYPGFHLREIARAVGLNPNHAKYHLRFLERHGLISSRREDGYWRFYPREEGSIGLRDVLGTQEKTALAFLRRPVPLHTLLVILDRGPSTHSDLLSHIQVAHATLHYHLQRMERSGVLSSEKIGRERIYNIVERERLLTLLMRYKPPDGLIQGFLQAWEQLEL